MSEATSGPASLERAWPWPPGRFSAPEPQHARGAVGSRDAAWQGQETRRAESGTLADPTDACGVNPLGVIDPSMPYMKPGDQGG